MGANAEGKISLSVELSNFKDIASNLKKGLSAELKQVPLDINFNNKELEQRTAQAIKDINTMLSKSRIKNLDFSSILPNFVNEINKQGISEEIRAEVAEGFRAGLSNLNEIVSKKNYDVFKRFDGEDLKRYFADLNNVEDMINAMEGLSKRQRSALLKTVAPSFSDLDKRGGKEAEKKYTKGAKKLSGIWQLRNEYSDVLQYATSESSTEEVIKELNEKAETGNLTKNDVKDLLGYITRYKYITGENTYDDLFESVKDQLKEDVRNQLIERTQLYFQALDKIYNSTAKEINYSDLLTGVENTTNKKLEGVYNSEAESIEKVKIGKAIKDRIKIKSDEKPELRKREKKEDTPDTTRRKTSSDEDLEEFDEDDAKEKEEEIKDYNAEIQKLDDEYNKLDKKMDELSDKATRLKKEVPEEEKKLNDLDIRIDDKQKTVETEKNRNSRRLNNLNERKEGLENQSKDIDVTLEKLQKRKEELANKIAALNEEDKKLDELMTSENLHNDGQKKATESYIKEIKQTELMPLVSEIKADEEALNRTYEAITSKRELQKLLKEKFEELKNINKEIDDLSERSRDESLEDTERWEAQSLERDKLDARTRLNLDFSRIYRQAVKQGVNEKTLEKYYREGEKIGDLDLPHYSNTPDVFDAYEQDNIDLVKEQLDRRKEKLQEVKAEIEEQEKELADILQKLNGFDYGKIKERQSKIPEERKAIEKEIVENNEKIFEQEFIKQRNADMLKGTQIDIDELQSQDNTKAEQELQQLKEQRNKKKKIYDEKKQANAETLNQMTQVEQQMNKIQDRKNKLIQKQEELNRQEEERKKKEEANKQKNKTDKTDSESKQEDGETKNSGTVNGVGTSIPSEKLEKILILLTNIQKALGTLEDGSDVPSITQSIKDMAEALKELNTALTEIKAKDFNLNIGLPNNNPIGQQGEAKRKILKELEQQYNELNSYFVNKYGDDSSAFDALSKLEGGSNYIATMMSDYSVIGDTNASLSDKIEVYKTLIDQLRNFLLQEGGDLNKIVSNILSPDEIIDSINKDVANTNPTTAISKLFENMQVSINASLAKINSESQGFNFLTGSAEEAAEAKRKFVEANKDVLQSIVASMPKIEQEAKALEKIEEVKSKTDNIDNNLSNNGNNIEDIKQQQELLKQEQLQIRAEQERKKIQQKFEEIQLKRNARLNEQRKQRAQDIKDRIGNRLNQPSAQQIAEAQLKEQQKIQQEIQEQLREDIYNDYSKSQEPQYDFELDHDNLAKQAQEARQIYEEEISKEFEVQVETKLNLAEDSTGQLSLFDNILPEDNWGQELKQNITEVSETAVKGQISFQDLEEAITKSETAFNKLMSSKSKDGKSFLQGTDLPDEFLKQYEGISKGKDTGYKATANLRELKNLGDELTDVKTKLKVSFDEAGNLKSTADPFEVQELLNKYDELNEKIQRLKALISSPSSQESFLLEEFKQASKEADELKNKVEQSLNRIFTNKDFLSGKDTDVSALNNYFEAESDGRIKTSDNLDKVRSTVEEILILKDELKASKNENGEIIGNPTYISEVIERYNTLTVTLKALIDQIKLPNSSENIALKLAEDAKKAQKELENLKSTVDKTLGKTNLFEARTQKTIDTYGAYEGNGEGKKAEFITPEVVGEKYGENFKQQQIQVQELIKQLGLYKTAVEELRTLRLSDETTVEQLTQANDKVKALEQNITTLSQTIKTSGVANATETQIESLRTKFETLLKNAPNLTKDVKEQIQEYIQTLSSGATVSKNAYSSMTADLRRFSAEQTRGSTIWEQMVGKMREGVAFLATKFSFYQIFNQFRQGFEVVHQFDDALTEMMKVSDETRLSLERYQKTTFETADAIGTNALQIQNSTADFMRLGETLDEAAKSAKAANILMNVSEFQSIDEATKSLIAMGAAYDDLSKMNIIDKLNEVGNNFAISTSEAATALQASASALTTANNDMDEALALITAGNAVVQDATKVGTGIRTIALRLTGTKSAKEELEEMGEETENVITTQSKLRDVIKEATAVASNEYKGFDILDDNGNYKSTYEIMLGIAEVYDEILETDKKFGRNNANLLLENVAGKVRANIAASIFQNPELLKEAYASSQSADNSAMRENEKYMQSISGHLAQLKNAWQEMWANAANREVINFFIDAAKAVVNFVNAIGLIPATFALFLPFLEMFSKARSGKGLVTSFLEWANGLNEIKRLTEETAQAQETLNAVKEAGVAINGAATASIEAETEAKVNGIAGSVGKTVADEAEKASTEQLAIAEVGETIAEEGSIEANLEGVAASTAKTTANVAEAASETGKEAAKATSKLGLLGGAFKGLASAIGLPTLAFAGFVAACLIAKKAYDAYNEARFNEAKQATDSIKQQQDSMSAQIESYKELKAQLDSGDLSEQETIETKQKILDIQKEITNQYGSAARGVDLINGKLEQQVGILNSITEKDADRQYGKNYEGFQVASREYRRERNYNVKLNNSNNSQLNEAMRDIYEEVGMKPVSAGMGTFNANVKKNAIDSIKVLEEARDSLEDLKKEYRDPIDVKAIDKQIAEIESEIGRAYEIVDKYEETALKGMELELARNQRNGYNAYQNYQTSTSDLESAYASGNIKKIEEARKAFDEANEAKNRFLTVEGNEQFTALFDTIDTSFVEIKNRFADTVKLLKDIPISKQEEGLFDDNTAKTYKRNSKELSKLTKNEKKAYKAAEKLYALNPDKIDIKATLDNNTYASGKYADALNDLMNAMGWASSDADSLIDALITAGVVQGDVSDAANRASDSYSTFSSSVNSAIESLTILNSALDESAKGTGLTEQTVQQLRNAFGDDLNSVLEKTANGYHLNVEGAYLLREQQTALIKSNYASALSEQYTALNKVKQGYLEAVAAGQDTTGFVQQRDAIQKNIDKLNESLMAYQNANSAYQTWLASQNSEGEREMYNSIYSGYDAVKDELERGFAGEKTRSWIDLIFNDEGEDWDAWTAPAEKINEMFKQVKKKIEGTGGFSIADFFTVDENGKSTSQGIWNFFKAIENKQDEVGQKFVDLENKKFNFNAFDIADLLGMDVEAVQSIVRAAFDAGFEIHMEQPLLTLDQLKEKADSAKKSLETIEGKKIAIDLDPTTIEEADKAMDVLTEYQQELLENDTIPFDVKTQKLEDTASLMDYIAAKKRSIFEEKLFEPEIQNTKLQKSAETISNLYKEIRKSTIESGAFNANQLEFFKIDPNAINDVDYLTGLFERIRHFQAEPELDQTQFLMFEELLKEIQARIDLLNNTDSSGGSLTVDQFMAADKLVTDINTKLDYANQHSHMTFDWDSDEQFIEDLNILANLPKNAKIELNIPTDASGEELLELAKKGELHIGVKVDGQIPQQPTDTYQTLHTQEEVTLGVTTVGTDAAQQVIQQFEEKNGTEYNIKLKTDAQEAETSIQEILDGSNEIDNSTPEATATLDDKATNPLTALRNLLFDTNGESATVFSYYQDPDNAHGELAYIDSHVYDRKQTITTEYKTIGSPSGAGGVNGSAHAFGTAFARGSILSGNAYAKGGNWGVPKNQTALVNEVGEEIIVRDGQWFVANGGNAGFTQLRKGDVVFNSEQSKELLEKGYITGKKRASIVGFANGSAFIGGTAYDYGTWDGALKPSKSSKGMGGSTTSKGSSNKGGNGNHGGGNSSKAKEEAKETKNTLDEVEILIARIERQISRLDSRIANTYTTWARRNISIKRNLEKVSLEIEKQQGAYKTYIDKAKSIGLPKEWVQKIHKGNLAIEDVIEKAKENGDTADSLWDKITKYRDYYEKALAAEDKILELQEKEGELYKQRFDNEQTYYEAIIDNIQHTIDLNDTYNEKLEESGRLGSKKTFSTQAYKEKQRLEQLEKEYNILARRRDEAVESGKVKKYSEAWREMQQSLNEVSEAIEEAEKNVISFNNAMREVDWTRWEKMHDTIGGLVDEFEFLRGLIHEDDMFDEKGDLTSSGITSYALLAQQYDTYRAEAAEYAKEIEDIKGKLNEDPNNLILVDKLKELYSAYQDVTDGAEKAKDAIIDQTENGFKKQIEYVKDLIDDYEKLLDAQKDQTDYAKKVSDQQKEINKLEKQYRAVQNDTSEEGAARRQRLREQIKEKKEGLKETQEDRRISETKDMLSEFSDSLEDFLEKKIKERENILKGNFNIVNDNIGDVKKTIEELEKTTGYIASDIVHGSLDNINQTLVNYFSEGYDSEIAKNTNTIIEGINKIISYYDKVQADSDKKAKQEQMGQKVRETGNHIQSYKNAKGETVSGYFNTSGTRNTSFTGWANNKTNYVLNGKPVANAWQTIDGKKYYFNKSGTKVTGSKSIGGKKYYFGEDGTMLTGWRKVGGKLHYYNPYMYTGKVTIGKDKYTFDENGVLVKEGWKKGTPAVPTTGYAWTNEGHKAEAIIRKSDGAILTPLNRGDSVIPNSAMKNLYQALTDPAKYLRQYTMPDIKVIQSTDGTKNSTPTTVNMQFIANGVHDANQFVNDLMNNKKLEKWVQEITLGQANGNNIYKKYSYVIR